VKKRDLERHLAAHGCAVARQGARHEIWAKRCEWPAGRRPTSSRDQAADCTRHLSPARDSATFRTLRTGCSPHADAEATASHGGESGAPAPRPDSVQLNRSGGAIYTERRGHRHIWGTQRRSPLPLGFRPGRASGARGCRPSASALRDAEQRERAPGHAEGEAGLPDVTSVRCPRLDGAHGER
jgi:hypothetical protein